MQQVGRDNYGLYFLANMNTFIINKLSQVPKSSNEVKVQNVITVTTGLEIAMIQYTAIEAYILALLVSCKTGQRSSLFELDIRQLVTIVALNQGITSSSESRVVLVEVNHSPGSLCNSFTTTCADFRPFKESIRQVFEL